MVPGCRGHASVTIEPGDYQGDSVVGYFGPEKHRSGWCHRRGLTALSVGYPLERLCCRSVSPGRVSGWSLILAPAANVNGIRNGCPAPSVRPSTGTDGVVVSLVITRTEGGLDSGSGDSRIGSQSGSKLFVWIEGKRIIPRRVGLIGKRGDPCQK